MKIEIKNIVWGHDSCIGEWVQVFYGEGNKKYYLEYKILVFWKFTFKFSKKNDSLSRI